MARSTGFPDADADDDFQRVRRRQVLAHLARRLRRVPDDVGVVLPFDDVVSALGLSGERHVGLQVIDLDSIVGSVDRARDFDRRWRPTSGRPRERWQRIDVAQRRGVAMPPISVYRIGDLHFVRDGHHRVSVARAMGWRTIEADVTEIITRIPPSGVRFRRDLAAKAFERVFTERVPLPAETRATLVVDDPWSWCVLSETVEAWGFRLMQSERTFLTRPVVAQRWYRDEYRPVVRMLQAAELIEDRTEVESYLTIAGQRYRLMLTHEWSDEVIERLRTELLR
jgi:hypothetical protein